MIELKYIANALLIIFGLVFIIGGINKRSRAIGVIPFTAGLLNTFMLYTAV